ncbi:hypothetical protein [Microbacterium sp. LWH12-1.2]|uniref:hypothetical protein n=1 Tax=Microbacterium sp. LWH12-1.2 TaxID=3135259 RepID=UPI003445D602
MNAFTFPLRQHIWQEDGIWWLNTGLVNIPHPTWADAWSHAAFIHRIRTEV